MFSIIWYQCALFTALLHYWPWSDCDRSSALTARKLSNKHTKTRLTNATTTAKWIVHSNMKTAIIYSLSCSSTAVRLTKHDPFQSHWGLNHIVYIGFIVCCETQMLRLSHFVLHRRNEVIQVWKDETEFSCFDELSLEVLTSGWVVFYEAIGVMWNQQVSKHVSDGQNYSDRFIGQHTFYTQR